MTRCVRNGQKNDCTNRSKCVIGKCENEWKKENIHFSLKKVGNCGGLWRKMRNFAPKSLYNMFVCDF